MKSFITITLLLVLCATLAEAQVRKSSRNLRPLTAQPEPQPSATQSERTTLGVVTPKREEPVETITKVTFLGPKTGWGIVKATAACYSSEGKHLGTVPGGTLFKYDDVKNGAHTSYLLSSIKRADSWSAPCLLECTAIAGFEGNLEKIDPAVVGNLCAYYSINGRIEERKLELQRESDSANPHAPAAQEAQNAYKQSMTRAAQLQKEMDAAKGPQRQKLLDELRTLKYAQAQLKEKADKATAASQGWSAAHKPDPATLANDQQLQDLQQELLKAREPIANLLQ